MKKISETTEIGFEQSNFVLFRETRRGMKIPRLCSTYIVYTCPHETLFLKCRASTVRGEVFESRLSLTNCLAEGLSEDNSSQTFPCIEMERCLALSIIK